MDATEANGAERHRRVPLLGRKRAVRQASDATPRSSAEKAVLPADDAPLDARVEESATKSGEKGSKKSAEKGAKPPGDRPEKTKSAKKPPEKKTPAKKTSAKKRDGSDASADKSVKRPKSRDVVAEGIYIASAATRLALKNRILVEVIVGGENFDVDRFVPQARETLLTLAAEAEDEAKRVRKQERHAWGRFDDSVGTHDYRSKDLGNLRRRRRQAARTASELMARAEDDAALRELVEAARDAAWTDVSRNIDSTLRIEAARPDLEADYDTMRDARMQALMLVDLQRLQTQQRRRAQAAAGEPLTETEDREKLSTAEILSTANGETDYAAQARANGLDPGELE